MSFLFSQPEILEAATTDLAGIGETISQTNVAAAVRRP